MRQRLHGCQIEAGVTRRTCQRSCNRAQIGLRGQSAHGVQRTIDRIAAGVNRCQHGGRRYAAGVVRVEVNRQADFLFQHAHQFMRSTGLADPRHVLDAQNMGAGLFQLLGQINVVLEVVLAALGIEQVAGVTQGSFAQGASLNDCVHRHAHVIDPVKRVKNAEHIDATFRRLLHKVAHHVVRVVGVAHRVGGAQQHLEQDVGCGFAQARQSLPRVLLQEAQGHVKGGAAPAFHREQLRQHAGVVRRNIDHVVGAHASGKQRLVGVAHGGVGQQHLRLGLHPVCELAGAQFL